MTKVLMMQLAHPKVAQSKLGAFRPLSIDRPARMPDSSLKSLFEFTAGIIDTVYEYLHIPIVIMLRFFLFLVRSAFLNKKKKKNLAQRLCIETTTIYESLHRHFTARFLQHIPISHQINAQRMMGVRCHKT